MDIIEISSSSKSWFQWYPYMYGFIDKGKIWNVKPDNVRQFPLRFRQLRLEKCQLNTWNVLWNYGNENWYMNYSQSYKLRDVADD